MCWSMDGCTDTVTSSTSFCEEICLPKKAVINNNKSSLRRFDRAQKSKEVVYKSGSRMEDKETKLNNTQKNDFCSLFNFIN